MKIDALRLLVAYDDSEGAKAAIDDLRHAGLPRENVEALVASVADVWMPPENELDKAPIPESAALAYSPQVAGVIAQRRHAIDRAMNAIQHARELADKGRERLCTLFPEWKVRTYACADSPAWGVLKKEREWRPDFTLVGATGAVNVDNVLFGSVSQKIVTKAAGAVRVGRARDKHTEPDVPLRLIVGMDGSPDAMQALKAVVARTWPPGSEARVITILDPRMATEIASLMPVLTRWVKAAAAHGETEFGWAYEMAHEATEQLRAAGLDASWTVQEGDSKHALLDEARHWDADCIFIGAKGLVGSSGLRGLERFFLGTTASIVSGRASCSIEVVRAPEN